MCTAPLCFGRCALTIFWRMPDIFNFYSVFNCFSYICFAFQGAKAATQIGAAAYVECSARTSPTTVQEVFEMASLATMGKLKLQKSYIDLPSACKGGTFPINTSSLRRLSIRKKSEPKIPPPVRVKAVVVERESRGCVVM